MKADFYCISEKKHVVSEVTGKRKVSNGSCQIIGKAKNGKTLTAFVSQDDYRTKYKSVKTVK